MIHMSVCLMFDIFYSTYPADAAYASTLLRKNTMHHPPHHLILSKTLLPPDNPLPKISFIKYHYIMMHNGVYSAGLDSIENWFRDPDKVINSYPVLKPSSAVTLSTKKSAKHRPACAKCTRRCRELSRRHLRYPVLSSDLQGVQQWHQSHL